MARQMPAAQRPDTPRLQPDVGQYSRVPAIAPLILESFPRRRVLSRPRNTAPCSADRLIRDFDNSRRDDLRML